MPLRGRGPHAGCHESVYSARRPRLLATSRMSDLNNLYKTRVPPSLSLAIATMTFLGLAVLWFGVSSYYRGITILASPETLGQQGEFFGGHLAAFAGSLTLAIVIYTGYAQQQQRFFLRSYFLDGAGLAAEAVRHEDATQALRVLDYFARLALSEHDDELFLVLNTVIAGDIRKQIETGQQHVTQNYPFVTQAVTEIGRIQKERAIARKQQAQP